MVPLENNRHRFCPTHQDNEKICSIVGCQQPVAEGWHTCSIADHRRAENVHNLRGQSRFQLQQRLERTYNPGDTHTANTLDGPVVEEIFEIADNGEVRPTPTLPPASAHGKKHLRAQFGRRRTFCQEIMVAPCGLIGYRTTFYGAEGVASVAVSYLFTSDVRHSTFLFSV